MNLKDKILKILQEEAISYDETEGTCVIFSDEFERIAERMTKMVKRTVKRGGVR